MVPGTEKSNCGCGKTPFGKPHVRSGRFLAAEDGAADTKESSSAKAQEESRRGTVRTFRQMVAKPDDKSNLVPEKDEEISRIVATRDSHVRSEIGTVQSGDQEVDSEDMEGSNAETLKTIAWSRRASSKVVKSATL